MRGHKQTSQHFLVTRGMAASCEGYESGDDESSVPAVVGECEGGHSDVDEDKVLHQEVEKLKQL